MHIGNYLFVAINFHFDVNVLVLHAPITFAFCLHYLMYHNVYSNALKCSYALLL